MTPDVKIKTVCLHLSDSSLDLPAVFGARIRAAGGKFAELRKKSMSRRYVTLPFSESDLIDELMDRYRTGPKTTMVIENLSSETLTWERCAEVRNSHMAVFHWQRGGGEKASAFLERVFNEKLVATDWSQDMARWSKMDRDAADRKRAFDFGNRIADLRERIAAEAVRIAEGANDIDPLKELAAEYAEVCAAAGVAIERKGDSELIVSAGMKP
ncbi:hypothetical protein [Rhizobium sp. BK176]|uniref:hypothetical protein n=1 Tax=Rhizobium sp. BK176 TaxID=2587071 RepID=UPI002168604C|nr:hypothetical protein [Rhizobium sp. BK176]MCS4089076.1 hypothetical protein [Rhizobium sp. BK176]